MKKKILQVLGLTFFVAAGFIAAQFVAALVVLVLQEAGVDFSSINESLFQTILSGVVYLLALAIVIGLPWWVRRQKTTKKELGLDRLPTWFELLISPPAFVGYMLTSGIVIALVTQLVPLFDVDQAQDIGFQGLVHQYEYILAFIALVVIAPVAEEILFRGYLYGKLKKHTVRWVAIIVVSALFGALHGQWNVAIDTFVLSVVACLLRDWTGSLWSPILLHMLKNGLAYYLLFINPDIIQSVGG